MKSLKFGERIAQAIKYSNYTQNQIADILGIAKSNITNWKKGENFPSLDVLFKLCLILDESADWLLGLEDETGKTVYNEKDKKRIDKIKLV